MEMLIKIYASLFHNNDNNKLTSTAPKSLETTLRGALNRTVSSNSESINIIIANCPNYNITQYKIIVI